jgi:hypothetical protein
MRENLENLLKRAMASQEPPKGLSDLILNRINKRMVYSARLRFGVFAGLLIASAVMIVPAARYFISEFYNSGFYSYISVILSDGGLAMTFWEDFCFVLADSFPIMAAASVLAALFVILGSVVSLVRDARFVLYKLNIPIYE